MTGPDPAPSEAPAAPTRPSSTAPPDGPIPKPTSKSRGAARFSAEDVAWLGAIAAGFALAAAAVWLAPELAKLYPAPNRDVFAIWQGQIAPEPREEVRSMLALGTPAVLALLVAVLGTARPPRRSLDPVILGAQVTGIGLLVWAILGQPRKSGFLAIGYFDQYLLSVPNLIAGACIGVLLTVVALRWSGRLPASILGLVEKLRHRGWIAVAIAVIATAIWLLPSVVTDGTIARSGPIAFGHITWQGADYFSVVNGRTPLVNFIANYTNLLPYVVAPVLAAFNSSIASFSTTMNVLTGVALLAILGVFTQVTRGTWTALALYVPFLALSLFPWNDVGPFRENDAIYYAVLPGRYLGPFLLAWLCAVSTRRRVPVWALFGLAGLVALNNAEFGVGALLALVAAMLVTWDRSSPLRRRLGPVVIQAAAGLLGAVAIVCAITLLRTGSLPDPSLLTYYSRVFWHDSYGLEPMSARGLHWALYATYAAALLVAAVRYVRADPDRTLTAMLAFSGVFGLTTAMYFVGRSSQFQLMLLFPAWAFALALVAWTAARSLRSAAGDRDRLWRLLVPGCAALIGFGVMISAIDRFPPPWRQVERLRNPGADIYALADTQQFVDSQTQPGEDVLIIGTPVDHRVADRAGVVNVSPLNGVYGLISPAEANRSLDQLQDEGGSKVFDAVSGPTAPGGVAPIPEFATILRDRGYRLIETDPSSHLRLWQRVG